MVLTAEAAKQQARERAGLSDFGPPDFEEGLEQGLAAFARLPLRPATRTAVEEKIIGDLAMRLRIEAYFAAHPDICARGTEGMVLVCGLPRTGTTATVGMLALDERFRFLRAWEAMQILPPPVAGQEETDPRRMAAVEAAKLYAARAKHLNDPDGPEEDLALLSGLTMHSYHGAFPMPDDYLRWWIDKDFAPHYAYLDRLLRLLQAQRPPYHWLLKSPPHMFKLGAFAAQFPNAKFIMTHRDPAKIIASAASLHYGLQAERCEANSVDPKRLGRSLLQFWREGMDRALAARAMIGEERFIDVKNDDVVKRPVETFSRIYEHLGWTLDAAICAKLAAYGANNAPGAFGEHKYEPEEYGLTTHEIHRRFQDYIGRFGV